MRGAAPSFAKATAGEPTALADGGIGSYPVLSNPHYHQAHDVLEFVNHELVAETSKTTAATLMLLASCPSRIKDLKVERAAKAVTMSWTASPEKGVTSYLVATVPPRDDSRCRRR